jgi:hypothetical protein
MTQDPLGPNPIFNPLVISTGGGDLEISAGFSESTFGFEWFWKMDFIPTDLPIDFDPAGTEAFNEALNALINQTSPDSLTIPSNALSTLSDGVLTVTVKTNKVLDQGLPTEREQRSEGMVLLIMTTGMVSVGDVQDSDNDGIPNSGDDPTVMPNELQTVFGIGTGAPVMTTRPGQTLALGQTARCAGTGGALLTLDQLRAVGGDNCQATGESSETTLAHETGYGGVFDFVLTGLSIGFNPAGTEAIPATGYVTLPLNEPLPSNAFYQKFSEEIWIIFDTSEEHGKLYSGMAVDGVCPAIPDYPDKDSGEYTEGLFEGDNCVLLGIVDGGANDLDGVINGQIVDPGTHSRFNSEPTTGLGNDTGSNNGVVANISGSGGCTLSTETTSPFKHAEWLLLGGAVGWMAMRRRRQQKLH